MNIEKNVTKFILYTKDNPSNPGVCKHEVKRPFLRIFVPRRTTSCRGNIEMSRESYCI